MKLTVKHKKGRFYADWYSTIKIFFFMLWRDEVEGIIYMNTNTVEKISDTSWLKSFGWKSGINTKTNTECIAAYKKMSVSSWTEKDHMIFGVYKRPNDDIFDWYISEYIDDISTNPYQYVIKYNIKRPKGCFIPVFPYAGGADLPENDYSYTLILK